MKIAPRWIAVGIFLLSTTLNYLDRSLFAALGPLLRAEFGMTYQDYGHVISVYSIVYAVSAPVMGLLIDRVGLNAGVSLAVGLWSVGTACIGFTRGLNSLLGIRVLLGFAQAGGIPATGKAISTYLEPTERALGTAGNQVGVSLGLVLAPLFAAGIGERLGWRMTFVAAGLLGFVWIPVWLFLARRTPQQQEPAAVRSFGIKELLSLRTFWGLVAANMFSMTVYSLWANWTTFFLVKQWSLTADVANRNLAWIPPLIAVAGGLMGGAASLRMMKTGTKAPDARRKASLWGGLLVLSTALAPMAPNPLLSAVCIGISFFGVSFQSVNIYALPLDLFGTQRAAFAVAWLTFAYGAMQAMISGPIGWTVDRYGFLPVCVAGSLLPLCAVGVLYATRER